LIRIHFTYRHVLKPWGGANNFISALNRNLAASGQFTIVDDVGEPLDILFMNQLGKGPASAGARPWRPREVRALLSSKSARPRLVVRAVNLNRHAFRMGPRNFLFGRPEDKRTLELLNMADLVIFQSEYQLGFFREAGYSGNSHSVVHNGADARYWVDVPRVPAVDGPLRLVSTTASPRETKCHGIIAAFSRLPGVEVEHFGAWPDDIDPGAVQRFGTRPPEDIVPAFSRAHYMLHPAIKDPCPNSIFEGVCAGLPVIYNPGPGSSREIVGECGIALDAADPGRTAAEARARLAELRATVLAKRASYAIDHAANRYRELFARSVSRS
jgi:glycosyltransferase involved in cell wall biosynthesis